MKMKAGWCVVACLLAAGWTHGVTARQAVTYEDLTPFANVVDIQGVWKALNLPKLPETFCHVGLVGWHCHNTTMHPWNPASIFPKSETPPMPANATCVICPEGWKGGRKNIVDVLLDIPIVQRTGKLPQGFYNMEDLKVAAKAVEAVTGKQQAAAAQGSGSSSGGQEGKVVKATAAMKPSASNP